MATIDGSPTLPPYRKPASITLPRNFAPVSFDAGDQPKTPDQTFAELNLPPPHHSTLRIRRPRLNLSSFQAMNNALPPTLFASDIPVPSSVMARDTDAALPNTFYASESPIASIEMPVEPSTVRPPYHHSYTDPFPRDRLRLPSPTGQQPTTPPGQTKAAVVSDFRSHAWDMERSSSVSSTRSDSSFSSCGIFTSRPTSFGGSVTSPEIDGHDPFSPSKLVHIIPDTPSRRSIRRRLNNTAPREIVHWSIEMDNHLFNVYQMYLGDPTVTPFKTVPGSIPPTGVCYRVARKAKTTWPKASMIPKPIVKRFQFRDVMDDRFAVREKTPEPNDFLRVRDSSIDVRRPWPSEKATRKRLKQLCKEKFTISAHYQRLRESRSPSPFAEDFTRAASGRITRSMSRQMSGSSSNAHSQLSEMTAASPESKESATFATRELGISLASGATAPLVQLVTGDSPDADQRKHDEWFNTSVDSSDRMSTSPPSGLGIGTTWLAAPASDIPRLASPFKPFSSSTWNAPSRPSRGHRREITKNQFDTVHATGSRLLSPFRIEPDVSNNANKRRAQHNLEDELSPSGSNIAAEQPAQELVFTGIGDISQRRIRLRNRGATLGAVSNQDRLNNLFAPPTPSLPTAPMSSNDPRASTQTTAVPVSSLALPEADERQKRLGSPFELDPNKRSNRSRAPRHIPTMSDPFVVSKPFVTQQAAQQSIGERLAQFANLHAQAGSSSGDPLR